jgi:hypothetical protein
MPGVAAEGDSGLAEKPAVSFHVRADILPYGNIVLGFLQRGGFLGGCLRRKGHPQISADEEDESP